MSDEERELAALLEKRCWLDDKIAEVEKRMKALKISNESHKNEKDVLGKVLAIFKK